MSPNDARAFLEVHHAAVREIAAADYPSAVVDDWAQLPLTDEAIEQVRANPDDEFGWLQAGLRPPGAHRIQTMCVTETTPASWPRGRITISTS